MEDLTQEPHKAEIKKAHDKLIHTEESDPDQISVQEVSDQNNPKTTEQGGSSWIGSAVNGLFGRNERSDGVNEPQDDSSDQKPFKSRRIAMDIEENIADEKTNPGTFGWIRGELTNAFGFKDSNIDAQDNIEKPKDEKEPSSQQSSSWLGMGMDVLGFGKDDASKPKSEIIHENIDMENQSNRDQSVDSVENKQKDENIPDQSVENEDRSLEDDKTEEKAQTGWYGTIYNRITDIYSKEQSESDEDDEDKDNVSKEESEKSAPNTEDKESIFSVSGFSSVLDNIKIPFQSDVVVKTDVERDKEQTTKDRGKKELDEKTDVSDVDLISEIQSDESITLTNTDASDAIGEIDEHSQDPQNNDTHDSTASETSEMKSTNNFTEDVTQNNADVSDRQMEQNQQRRLRSEEVDSGEKDFLEHNTSPTDLISETQELSDDRKTLKDIREVNDTSHDDDTQESKDSEVSQIKSADNSIEDVIQSKKNLMDSNGNILEDVLKQNLSDRENDNENTSSISISTNPVVSSDSDDIHTSELPESATETQPDDKEKQISDTKSNIETITISQNRNADSKTIINTLSGHSDEHILAVEDKGTEIKNDSLSILDVTEINETQSDEVSEDKIKNDETLSDSETEISDEYKSNTSTITLDESENGYAFVHNHETESAATSEENIHSDIEPESHSAHTIIDENMENTTEPHNTLYEANKADISIRDANTEGNQTHLGGHQDGVTQEQKEPSIFSQSTESDLETKELNTGLNYAALNSDASTQNETRMKNEYLSEEASTEGELDGKYSFNDSTDVKDNLRNEADANNKDVITEDPADHTSSETKSTSDLFAENDPKSHVGAENVEHQTKVDSTTGETQDQTDVDMTAGEELHSQIQDKDDLVSSTEIKRSQKPSEEYPNLYSHLSEQNIKDVLDIVGDYKLAWLDSKIGSFSNVDAGRDNDDLAELSDFEQLLEYHINTRRHIQNDEHPALQKLSFLLCAVRETYTPGNTNMKVDESPGTDDVHVLKLLQSITDDNCGGYCMGIFTS